MYSKILILRFPKTEAQSPVVCYLAKDYDLTFTILRATVFPRKEGLMVLELSGSKEHFKQGIQYLKDQGVNVKTADQEIIRDEEKCTHCGACTAVCPTGALSVERPEMSVSFTMEKCSVCKLCIPTCPVRAMVVSTSDEDFFD